jgi:rhodanese-related sulfurtransferase
MKLILPMLSLFTTLTLRAEVPRITPVNAAALVSSGTAVLVDVREPAEWTKSGVAAPAVLLSKSDFDAGRGGEWKSFLKSVGDKPIIVYCHSGRRAAQVGAALAAEGHKVMNAGGFSDWEAAGLPTRKVAPKP